jgi:ribosomal protein S6
MIEEGTKKEYELSYLAKTEEAAKGVAEVLKSQGAEVTTDSPASKINLTYKIKGESSAYFGCLHFSAAPADVKPIEDVFRLKSDILRILVITPPFLKNKPRMVAPRPRTAKPSIVEARPSEPLSNEALEKKIEEILNQ